MSKEITGKDLVMFIIQNDLLDATIDTPETVINFRKPYSDKYNNGDEYGYNLYKNGLFSVEVWIQEKGEWVELTSGSVFKEVK